MPKLTKGSKQVLKEFDQAVKRRRQYILQLLMRYSKKYRGNGRVYKNRSTANNATHHNVMNNLRKPRSQDWEKKRGVWQCNGCAIK